MFTNLEARVDWLSEEAYAEQEPFFPCVFFLQLELSSPLCLLSASTCPVLRGAELCVRGLGPGAPL